MRRSKSDCGSHIVGGSSHDAEKWELSAYPSKLLVSRMAVLSTGVDLCLQHFKLGFGLNGLHLVLLSSLVGGFLPIFVSVPHGGPAYMAVNVVSLLCLCVFAFLIWHSVNKDLFFRAIWSLDACVVICSYGTMVTLRFIHDDVIVVSKFNTKAAVVSAMVLLASLPSVVAYATLDSIRFHHQLKICITGFVSLCAFYASVSASFNLHSQWERDAACLNILSKHVLCSKFQQWHAAAALNIAIFAAKHVVALMYGRPFSVIHPNYTHDVSTTSSATHSILGLEVHESSTSRESLQKSSHRSQPRPHHSISDLNRENSHIYKWTKEDPRGVEAFRNHHHARGADDEAVALLPELMQNIDQLHDLASKQVPQPDMARQTIARLYDQLHCDSRVLRWSAEQRALDPEETNLRKYMTPLKTKLWYWMIPVAIFVFFFSVQSVLLHVATSLYIRYMDKLELAMLVAPNKQSNATVYDMLDVQDFYMIRNGQLFDVIGDFIGRRVQVPMKLLDMTGIVPVLLYAGSYLVTTCLGDSQIELWTKTFLVASVMALVKGVFDVVTIMPDSRGWKACQAALTPKAVAALRDLNFADDFWGSTFALFALEIVGVPGVDGRVRYCADMLVSGHTYFAALFSLSTYKMIRYQTGKRGMHWVRYSVGGVLIACVGTEVVLVALNKFHYTVDMLASILLVVLLFDSIHLETLAARFVEAYFWRDPKHYHWQGLCPLLGLCPKRCGQAPAGLPPDICPSTSRKLVNMWHLRGFRLIDAPIPQHDDDPRLLDETSARNLDRPSNSEASVYPTRFGVATDGSVAGGEAGVTFTTL